MKIDRGVFARVLDRRRRFDQRRRRDESTDPPRTPVWCARRAAQLTILRPIPADGIATAHPPALRLAVARPLAPSFEAPSHVSFARLVLVVNSSFSSSLEVHRPAGPAAARDDLSSVTWNVSRLAEARLIVKENGVKTIVDLARGDHAGRWRRSSPISTRTPCSIGSP